MNSLTSFWIGFCLIFGSVIVFRSAWGQSDKQKKFLIGVGSGYAYTQNRDDLTSPLRYQGGAVPLQGFLAYRGSHNRHQLSVSYSSYVLESQQRRNANFQEDLRMKLQYAYLGHLSAVWNDRVQIFVGGTWDNIFSMRAHQYRYPVGLNAKEYSGEFLTSIGLKVVGIHPLGDKRELALDVTGLIFGYIIRPGYGNSPTVPDAINVEEFFLKGLRPAGLNKLQFLQVGFEYRNSRSSAIDFLARYQFIYFRYPYPQPVRIGINSIELMFGLKL